VERRIERKAATSTEGLTHDVSILLGSRHLGSQPRAKHLDDDHARATAGMGKQHTRVSGATSGCFCGRSRPGDIEECAAVAMLSRGWWGQRAVVADAVETLRQHMQQEAPDELVRVKPHVFQRRAVDAIVLPAKCNGVVIGCNEAAFEIATRWV